MTTSDKTLALSSNQQRVRLLKDIFDDGEDHHPPGFYGRKGDVVVVRVLHAIGVSHEGREGEFIVRGGEFEPITTPFETLAPPARRHSRDCDCHDCHYSKKHPQVKPHHARCGCFECAPRGPVETNDIARDAARYRFLRQPGNAIVYAKDRDAWGRNASGHVRYDTAEQLDAAVDAASNAVKASETSEDARLAESVTGFLEHAEKHGLQTEDQLAESQLTKANEPAPPPTDEGARLQPTGSASGTEWKGMGGGAAVRCPHGVVVENPRDWLGWSFCEKCPDCIATWKDEGSPLLLTKRRIREIARHCNPTLTDGEFAAMWMTWMLAGPP